MDHDSVALGPYEIICVSKTNPSGSSLLYLLNKDHTYEIENFCPITSS